MLGQGRASVTKRTSFAKDSSHGRFGPEREGSNIRSTAKSDCEVTPKFSHVEAICWERLLTSDGQNPPVGQSLTM